MMESEGVRGGSECRETTSEGKWPINLERNVDQEFTGKDNTREREERRRGGRKENRMIFLHTPPKCSHRERDSAGNISDGGKKKIEGEV